METKTKQDLTWTIVLQFAKYVLAYVAYGFFIPALITALTFAVIAFVNFYGTDISRVIAFISQNISINPNYVRAIYSNANLGFLIIGSVYAALRKKMDKNYAPISPMTKLKVAMATITGLMLVAQLSMFNAGAVIGEVNMRLVLLMVWGMSAFSYAIYVGLMQLSEKIDYSSIKSK